MLTAEQEQMRRSEPEMQIALRRAKPHSKVVGHSATCPSPDHDDKTPSGSYKTSEDGFVHFCCHACNWHGDVFDVLAVSSGRSVEQVLADYRDRPNRPAATAPSAGVPKAARTFTNYEQLRGVKDAEEQRRFNATFEAAHFYENPNTGRADLLILRYRKPPEEGQAKGKKDMPQFHERPDGVFVEGKPAGLQPMYRRKENRGAKSIIALEGEVKVDTLLAIGFNATCWPGGCGAVGQADIGWLDGAERVTLWPDNDDNGRLAMKKFAARLQEFPHPPEIAWINPADFDLAEGEDVVDLARQCERAGVDAKQTIADAIEHAKVSSLSEGLRRRFKEIIAGTWSAEVIASKPL